MISNDLIKELDQVGIKATIKDENIVFIKDDKEVEIKISSIRRMFFDSLVSYISIESEK